MGEKAEVKSIEEKVAAVDSWVGKIALEGKVDEIDRVPLDKFWKAWGPISNFQWRQAIPSQDLETLIGERECMRYGEKEE